MPWIFTSFYVGVELSQHLGGAYLNTGLTMVEPYFITLLHLLKWVEFLTSPALGGIISTPFINRVH